MTTYGLLFIVPCVLVLVLAPVTARLARRVGALDYPGYRKIHDKPLPRLGGLAVFVGVSAGIILAFLLVGGIRHELFSLRGMFVGGLIILALGIIDDIHNVRPPVKLTVHCIAAIITVYLGVRFQLASNPLAKQIRDYFNLGLLGTPLTVIWIVGLTNAMNLVDGLDGLATGISLFSSIALFLISIQQGASGVAYVYAAIAGATLAFLRYNHFPAKMFLGDTGATFLGFTFACLSVRATQKSYTLTALFIPIIVFGIPIFETIVTFIRRYLARDGVLQADKRHVHHLLVASGLSQRQAVLLLYSVTILFGILGFTFTVLLDLYAALILLVVGLLAGVLGKALNVFGTLRPSEVEQSESSNAQVKNDSTSRRSALTSVEPRPGNPVLR